MTMGDVLFSYLGLCPAGNAHTELLVQDMKTVCLFVSPLKIFGPISLATRMIKT